MTLLRRVTGSESEHFAQLLLALTFIEIKSLQRALQTHCAFHNQARETINICTLTARFPKFLQNLSFSPHFCSFYRWSLIPSISFHCEKQVQLVPYKIYKVSSFT